MEIDSIVNSLKIMSRDSNYKIYVSGSLPMNVGFQLKAKATQADLKRFDKIITLLLSIILFICL